jgi:hypothetical protein
MMMMHFSQLGSLPRLAAEWRLSGSEASSTYRMGLQSLILLLGAALLQLPTSSFAQQAETALTHEHYVEIARQRKLMHQMVRGP